MKQAALWLLPAVALTSVGSLTYATSQPRIESSTKYLSQPPVDEGTKRNDSHIVSKTVPFAHDSEIDTYLTSVRSFMLTPPRDGRFGASRIPTFHGVSKNKIPGYNEIEKLGDGNSFASFVVGETPQEMISALKDYKEKHPEYKLDIPKYRVTYVHHIRHQAIMASQSAAKETVTPKMVVNKVKEVMDSKGYETYSQATEIDGIPGWVMAKAVRASDKSCYGCHNTVKEGEPIGHVVAILWKKASK